ncbi:MAG: hypothetical protein IPL27_17680 [Lewinellaceae bacterium]|nr:hypothetical protein [Lewinellaceae bacterium]
MDELIELISSININKLKSGGLWRFIFEPDSLMEQLCEAIHDGRVRSDEDAIALLYPGQKPGAKFINLRERLQERILSVVFLLEFRTPGVRTGRKPISSATASGRPPWCCCQKMPSGSVFH